jgi:hypothetical protein
MEMHRRMDEWRVINQKISSLDLYPASTLLPGELPHGVNPRQAKLLGLITGWFTVAELAEVMQKPVLTVAKDLYDLVMTGQIVLKGVRSGRKPELPAEFAPAPEAPAPPPPAPPEPSFMLPPVTLPPQGFPVATEQFEVEPEVAPPPPAPPAPPVPPAGAVTDPVKITKLNAFTQRIATTARGVLPPQHHGMVNDLLADATQRVNRGEGPEAVKNLALTISRAAVDAGCDSEMVKTLNAQLKALFSK